MCIEHSLAVFAAIFHDDDDDDDDYHYYYYYCTLFISSSPLSKMLLSHFFRHLHWRELSQLFHNSRKLGNILDINFN